MDFILYISVMLIMHIMDESWNCNHPREKPSKQYMVCQWDINDFYLAVDGNYYPYPVSKKDNYFERKARKKYWLRTVKEKG